MQNLLKAFGADYKVLSENYGPVELSYGGYPYCSDGGVNCSSDRVATPASADQMERAANALRSSVERGGNNSLVFQTCPQKKIVGTGCMNPMCECPNCQGDCVCGRSLEAFGASRDSYWWIGVVLMAFIVYYLMSSGKSSKRR